MPVAIMRLSEDLRLLHTARSGSWYTEYTTWSQHGKELKLREIFPIKFPFMAILILYSLRNFLSFGINNKITLFFAFWTIGWSLDSPFANWRLPIVRHYCPNWSQICCRWTRHYSIIEKGFVHSPQNFSEMHQQYLIRGNVAIFGQTSSFSFF